METTERQTAVDVRDAAPADARTISEIAHAAWPATYTGVFEDEFIRLVLERTYEPEALAGTIARCAADRSSHFLVAERAGTVVAYLHYGPGAGGAELHRIYVRPDLTGEGIGSALLRELNRRLEPGTSYVALVHRDNAGALRFYERHGFEAAGRVDGMELFREREGFGGGGAAAGPGCDVLVRYRVGG